MKKRNNKKLEAVDHVLIIACLGIWYYIYEAVNEGVLYLRAIQVVKNIQPNAFWISIFFLFLGSIICLYFVFFHENSEE